MRMRGLGANGDAEGTRAGGVGGGVGGTNVDWGCRGLGLVGIEAVV